MTPQQKAFLDTIAFSEIGPALLAVSDNGYNVLVGATADDPLLFPSYADHPRVYNAALDSTAAGRYQIVKRNFDVYKTQLNLPDFSPASQDRIALQLMTECNALYDLGAGNISSAIIKCASRWASFPGADYGQHENKMSALLDAFTAAGGTIA